MTIYVGNIAYAMTVEELKELFVVYGNVTNVKIIVDQQTGKSKGYGFVEMEHDEEAEKAIHAINNTLVKGRNIKANNAHRKNTTAPHKE
jgi:RNA recognition motif-containing protein